MKRVLWTLCGLFFASAAFGGDYLSDSQGDWFRYRNSRTGQEVTSRMFVDGGANNWKGWSNFAGLGDRYIYTYPNNNFFWIWTPGVGAQLMPTIDGTVGYYRNVNLGPLNNGRITVAERGVSLTTTAGTFTDVVRFALQPSAADAGVTSIWFARGVGVVKWEESSFAGPVEYGLVAAAVAGRTFPAAPTAPTNPTNPGSSSGPLVGTGMRAPNEHVQIEGMLWGCNDTYLVSDCYADAWAAMDGRGVLSECAVPSNQDAAQVRYEMNLAGTPLDDVDFLVVAIDSVWMRDYGPIILKDYATGERRVADPRYYPGRNNDDRFPAAYATYRGWQRVAVNVSFEGGNFATDGRGRGFVSRGVQWFNPNMSNSQILAEFRKLGCDTVEYFEPLVDEGTTHIDMFVRVVNDTTAVVSRYPSSHRQSPVVNAAANRLAQLGYNVLRVDADYQHDEYGTYANAISVNGLQLVPQYVNSTKNRAALDVYNQAGFQAVGVDNRLIIQYGGAIHCISMQVPR